MLPHTNFSVGLSGGFVTHSPAESGQEKRTCHEAHRYLSTKDLNLVHPETPVGIGILLLDGFQTTFFEAELTLMI